jgi:hypothetical protein
VTPSSGSAATIAISVHGPVGVLDMVVPAGATPVDVGRAYADQAGLSGIPLLQTPLGEHLRADLALGAMGVESGTVLIAATGVRRPKPADEAAGRDHPVADSPQVAAVGSVSRWVPPPCRLVRRPLGRRLAAHPSRSDCSWRAPLPLRALGQTRTAADGRSAGPRRCCRICGVLRAG